MSVSFISISTKINKTIHNNQKSQDEINTYISNLNNDLDVLSSEKYFIQQESPHIFYYSFKKNESINLSFSWSSYNLIAIDLLSWWPIEYDFESNKQIVEDNVAFSGSINNTNISLNNLGWYSFVKIETSAEIQKPFERYIKWIKVWNQNIIKEYWTINNN